MSQNVSSDEFNNVINTINTEIGQLKDRVHQLESRPRSVQSHNQDLHDVSGGEENESHQEGHYVYRRGEYEPHRNRHERFGGGNIKMTPPTFAGKVDPDGYFDWEQRMNNIFDTFDYSEERKVAIATAQLTNNAISWWDGELVDGRRRGERGVATWQQMKSRMRARYVPAYYHRDLQKRFRRLSQGNRSVEDYYEEFELLRNRMDCEESTESLMAQFLDGLKKEHSKTEQTGSEPVD